MTDLFPAFPNRTTDIKPCKYVLRMQKNIRKISSNSLDIKVLSVCTAIVWKTEPGYVKVEHKNQDEQAIKCILKSIVK